MAEAQESPSPPHGRITSEVWILEIQSSWTWNGRNPSWPYFYCQVKAQVWTVQESRWLEINSLVKTHEAGYSWDSNWRADLCFSPWENRCLKAVIWKYLPHPLLRMLTSNFMVKTFPQRSGDFSLRQLALSSQSQSSYFPEDYLYTHHCLTQKE